MIRSVVLFEPWHLDYLDAAEPGPNLITPEIAKVIAPQARTILLEDRPIMCGGVIQYWPGRWMLWANLSPNSARHMLYITQQTRKYLNEYKGRIEFTVRKDFIPGQRWAKALGFTVETPLLKAFGPEGEDHVGYAKWHS